MKTEEILKIIENERYKGKGLEPFAELIAKIVTVYENSGFEVEDTDIISAFENMNPPPIGAKEFLSAFCEELNFTPGDGNTPSGVSGISLSMPPKIGNAILFDATPKTRPIRPIILPSATTVRIHIRRSRRSIKNGILLAKMAKSFHGHFKWMPRWSAEIAPLRTYREIGEQDKSLGEDPNGTRSFALWLNGLYKEPRYFTAMNCWESVLFCAYKSGMLLLSQLRAGYEIALAASRQILEPKKITANSPPSRLLSIHMVHQKESLEPFSNDLKNALIAYVRALNRCFFHSTEAKPLNPFNLSPGTIPRAGDLIFVNGGPEGHVAISLGRTWIGGQSYDKVMSLWHHNGRRFALLDLRALVGSLSFLPCPF